MMLATAAVSHQSTKQIDPLTDTKQRAVGLKQPALYPLWAPNHARFAPIQTPIQTRLEQTLSPSGALVQRQAQPENSATDPTIEAEAAEMRARFDAARAQHEARLQAIDELDQPHVLTRAGTKTDSPISSETPKLIQSALAESRILRPYLRTRLGTDKGQVRITDGKFKYHETLDDFAAAWATFTGQPSINITQNLRQEAATKGGFYDRAKQTIHLNPKVTFGEALHEAIHKVSSRAIEGIYGHDLNEGVTQYFTDVLLDEHGLPAATKHQYGPQLTCAKMFVHSFGQDAVANFYFSGSGGTQLLQAVLQALSLTHMELIEQVKQDKLCARIQALNAGSVGNTGQRAGAPGQQLQRSLKVNAPGDQYEQEADRVADQVMRIPKPQVQRKSCACGKPMGPDGMCDECKQKALGIQRMTSSDVPQTTAPPIVDQVLQQSGHPLDSPTRNFMEARFGQNFGQVRVHTGGVAARSAADLTARAYTVGQQVVFGAGEYQPQSTAGRTLLAHELTHVVQQEGQAGVQTTLQRNVRANSSCDANQHGAPGDSIAALTRADQRAQNMALSCSHLLFLEALTFADPTFGRSNVFDAYAKWLGTPTQTSAGKWQSRFRSTPFDTEDEAIQHEMLEFSDRFERISNWLQGDIRYRCIGTSTITVGSCRGNCGPVNRAAFTCPGSRTIAICSPFWGPIMNNEISQGALIIHEAIHALLGFRNHPTATVAGRGRNPGCYEGFVHEIFHPGVTPGDCTAIVVLPPVIIPITPGP